MMIVVIVIIVEREQEVAGNRADRAEVQRANLATRSALVVSAADIERAATGQDAIRKSKRMRSPSPMPRGKRR